jgi:germination protein M
MKINIILKKLSKKAGLAVLLCCLFILLTIPACTPSETITDETVETESEEKIEEEAVEEPTVTEEVKEVKEEEEETTEEEVQKEDNNGDVEEEESEEITINVYYSDQMAEYLVPESRVIPLENKYVEALYELMKKPIDESLVPLMPDTTKINSVKVEDSNALVDLSQEFLDDRFVSDTVDILLLYSIVNTLTQFPEINSVNLYIDGEKLDILGQLSIEEPVFRRNDLIKN